ncbi:MAG TPA: hypothetical protein VFH66_01100 [Mycobacteriales bacterium]|nr:hypothetical protein [Mycobacteriales bacterium]
MTVLVAAITALGAASCSSQTDRHTACSQISQVLAEVDQTLHRVSSGGATPEDVKSALADEGGNLSSIARHSPGDLRNIGQRLSDDVDQIRVDLLERHGSAAEMATTRVEERQFRDSCR